MEARYANVILAEEREERHEAVVQYRFGSVLGEYRFSARLHAGLAVLFVNMERQIADLLDHAGAKVPAILAERLRDQ